MHSTRQVFVAKAAVISVDAIHQLRDLALGLVVFPTTIFDANWARDLN